MAVVVEKMIVFLGVAHFFWWRRASGIKRCYTHL